MGLGTGARGCPHCWGYDDGVLCCFGFCRLWRTTLTHPLLCTVHYVCVCVCVCAHKKNAQDGQCGGAAAIAKHRNRNEVDAEMPFTVAFALVEQVMKFVFVGAVVPG